MIDVLPSIKLLFIQPGKPTHNGFMPVNKWHKGKVEKIVADATLDIIIHKSRMLELKGEFLRKKNLSNKIKKMITTNHKFYTFV